MTVYTFFFNPQSRAQIARWALHEAGAGYDGVIVPLKAKPQALLDANPMAKLPTLIHHHGGHDHVVTEAAAICHYVAEMSAPDLSPRPEEKADYFRWLFFAAGPLEQGVTAHSLGWSPTADQEAFVGLDNYDRMIDNSTDGLAPTILSVGTVSPWAMSMSAARCFGGLLFGTMPERAGLIADRDRVCAWDAYQAAWAVNDALIAEQSDGWPESRRLPVARPGFRGRRHLLCRSPPK